MSFQDLNFDPTKLPRELAPNYITATEKQIDQMLSNLGKNSFEDLFKHISNEDKFEEFNSLKKYQYEEYVSFVKSISSKNKIKTSFLGDGISQYKVPSLIPFVCSIRGLTTAYTPYQPERCQGTLQTLWIYSSALSMLTGFEAINTSFYDRSTCLYEALATGVRLHRKSKKVLVSNGIYPGDKEVLETLKKETQYEIDYAPLNQETGLIDFEILEKMLSENNYAAFAFPQINHFGQLEDIHKLTDITREKGIKSIGIIDPILLASDGLLMPSKWGKDKLGVDMIVGEGQHLAIGPNSGGPGLGIFGIRFNEKNKTAIRSTAGRFVGKAIDSNGNECLCMVLSTREQHIRREKATSNICSNQGFLATLAGAAILSRGENGMNKSVNIARENAKKAFKIANQYEEISSKFEGEFFNEFTLEISSMNAKELISLASKNDIHIGIDLSDRTNSNNLILMSLSDIQTKEDLTKLDNFLAANFTKSNDPNDLHINISNNFLQNSKVGLPNFKEDELKSFYTKLGQLNVSPDDDIYPLGSCTMKYNPHINDWAANLEGFTNSHPQAPSEDLQGTYQILHEIEKYFKTITGLPGVTTQPVAGAQGELVGLKMFQAYHSNNGEKRDIILIPSSAHGTNPATVTMAGIETVTKAGRESGIVQISADQNGEIDLKEFKEKIDLYGKRIIGMMVTNPNTSGIFETNFKKASELIHNVGGLVYMDGANMNAIAGIINLNNIGVDAVHNNLHKTWSIPHGGGGPGDGIVAVSDKLIDYLPGKNIVLENGIYKEVTPKKTIGSFHRHFGNFAHKVRCHAYISTLGASGIKAMTNFAVLSANYLHKNIAKTYPTLPENAQSTPRMHEFILTLSKDTFEKIEKAGIPKAQIIAKVGKLFLDFGLHAPTIAFPEVYGIMIEPTESFDKDELDRFIEVVKAIDLLINEYPQVLKTAPHFTAVSKIDEVYANKNLYLSENIQDLPSLPKEEITPKKLMNLKVSEIVQKIIEQVRTH